MRVPPAQVMPANPYTPPPLILIESSSSFALPHLNLMKKDSASSQGQTLPYSFPSVMKLLLTSSLVFPPLCSVSDHCSSLFSILPYKEKVWKRENKQACRWGLGKCIPPATAQRDRKNPNPGPMYDLLASSKFQRLIELAAWCKTHRLEALHTALLQPEGSGTERGGSSTSCSDSNRTWQE